MINIINTLLFSKHLINRGLKLETTKAWVDFAEELVTFPLWNASGKLVGYQTYNWNSSCKKSNGSGRYYTYFTKGELAVYGLEDIDLASTEPLYIVEGIWDAIRIKAAGKRCIAVLSCNPKHLREWLSILPCEKVAVCDGDKAGKLLEKCCGRAIVLPEGTDANDYTHDTLGAYLEGHNETIRKKTTKIPR